MGPGKRDIYIYIYIYIYILGIWTDGPYGVNTTSVETLDVL